MPNGKHLAPLQRIKARYAWDPERLLRLVGQAVIEDTLEAAVLRLRKRLANAAVGIRIATKRGIGHRLVVGGDA
jgi:hypothetical protein